MDIGSRPYERARLAIAVVSVAVACVLHAQAPAPPVRPAGGGQPARDAAPANTTGTAVIRGHITDGGTGRGLRRARVQLSSPALGREGRSASTDPQGRYEIKDLPAGRYTMTVRRTGYLPLRYGQRRPYEPGKPLDVADRQALDNVDFALPKMSVISGRVTDELGEPIENTLVLVMRTMYFNGQRRLVPTGRLVRTDDGGNYRQSGLSPGTYFVQARAADNWVVDTNGVVETLGYVPTYYPGTVRNLDAQRVTVGVGKEVAAIDFSLIPGRSAKISGTAFTSQGQPFKRVSLGQEVRGDNFGSFGGGGGGDSLVGADGSFSIANITPGEYKLTASTLDANGPGAKPEAAIMTLVVDETDMTGLSLIGSSGGSMSGRISTIDGSPLPKNVTMTVSQQWLGQPDPTLLGVFRGGAGAGNADIKDDGAFAIRNIFGPARFNVTLPPGWAVKSITRRGDDITDANVEMKSDEEWGDIEVLLTNRVTTLTGQLRDVKGVSVDGTMIAFPADAMRWFDASRHIRAARPAQTGVAEIAGLPPGDYLVVGVDYVEDGAWFDREYLEAMREYATKVRLVEAATQPVSLTVVLPQP